MGYLWSSRYVSQAWMLYNYVYIYICPRSPRTMETNRFSPKTFFVKYGILIIQNWGPGILIVFDFQGIHLHTTIHIYMRPRTLHFGLSISNLFLFFVLLFQLLCLRQFFPIGKNPNNLAAWKTTSTEGVSASGICELTQYSIVQTRCDISNNSSRSFKM